MAGVISSHLQLGGELFSAPLQVFEHSGELEKRGGSINVCVGREWYHYPNSMFLPDNARLRFESGFDGLLPGDFRW